MTHRLRTIGWLGLLVSLHVMENPAQAQTFVSGSTGSLGAFAPATNMTVTLPADGILNYTTVTIPPVSRSRSSPMPPMRRGRCQL